VFVAVWEWLSSTDVADVATSSGDTVYDISPGRGTASIPFQYTLLGRKIIVLNACVYTIF